MLWLALVAFLPIVIWVGLALGLQHGLPLWTVGVGSCAALACGVSQLLSGVSQSCAIDESECLGASAVAYGIGFMWSLIAIPFFFILAKILFTRAQE
jgi:hypothetical protein